MELLLICEPFAGKDELIRQVTVGCVEQGLLLFRIRNELNMTINCYRRAYESGVCFGISKAVEAEIQLEKAQHNVGIIRLMIALIRLHAI